MNSPLVPSRFGTLSRTPSPSFYENISDHIKNLRSADPDRTVIDASKIFALQTAIQRSQAAQAAAESANKAKTDFLADMSHEIRTPMGAIIGLTNVLLLTELSARQRQCLTLMQRSAEALMTMLKGLLDIGKIESGTIQLEHAPFNMSLLLSQIVGIMSVKAQEKDIDLLLHYEPGLSETFVGDSGRIRQIVLNLVGNAIKFTETGRVIVSYAAKEEPDGRRRVSIAVTDSGIGIPPDKVDIIFERFIQADHSIAREYGGTGLGLSISKALAEKMGGDIDVTSVVGKGSTFTLCVPL